MAVQATGLTRDKERIITFSTTAKKFHQEVTNSDRTRPLGYHLTQITNKYYGSTIYKLMFKK